MDFFQIKTKETSKKTGALEAYPDFVVGRSKDLMVRGSSFYAIWDEAKGLWSTDEYDVQRLVDEELNEYAAKNDISSIKYMRSFSSSQWTQYRRFLKNVSDNSHQLDNKLTFANTEVKKKDYVSRRLPYNLASGDFSAWDELVGTLYSPEERAKIEWAIGAIVSGDAKNIEKFVVFYGPGGTGKSTIMKIVHMLFKDYVAMFEAKALTSNGNSFATEMFKNNPLVAIQHDGDLSRIEDNTTLNSIVSHEEMNINEKYKPRYDSRINAFLFMGTNKPVRISDAKSGLIRRLIDVHPTGKLLDVDHYHVLMARVEFELGAIAQHCFDVYRNMGRNYYNGYRPIEMMLQTDVFFNFIEACFFTFKKQDGATLKQAYSLYKEFCIETGIEKLLPQYKFREELRNYFKEFKERETIDGVIVRSYYSGFKAKTFRTPDKKDSKKYSLVLSETKSILDEMFSDQPAQGWKSDEFDKKVPVNKWSNVSSTLTDIDTSNLHFVKIPENHIVIDFDITDDSGEKSLEKNLVAASEWPATYAELSQGGSGVHLHYHYDGDVTELAQKYSDGVEVKTLLGDASLRRRLTRCNSIPVATISSGLPFKEKNVLDVNTVQSELGLRNLIKRNLNKEIHPGTKPSISFIKKILDEAYESGMSYDVSDLYQKLVIFAGSSTNQAPLCLKIITKMKLKSDDNIEEETPKEIEAKDDRIVFYDVEVYPNLFVVCWKYDLEGPVVPMINPSPQEVEMLLKMKLVGFFNRQYDNHILYARLMGYMNEQLYSLSQKLMNKVPNAKFGAAYGLSWTDIYDFSSKKQSLKKFEIELGLRHLEMDLPWDQPVPEDQWDKVVEYCSNDVLATEATFHARKQDYNARMFLAELSGLTANDTTQQHTARIIFGEDRNPQRKFKYTHLDQMFPGYVYNRGKSTYQEEEVGEGGYIYAKPGIYENVALLDVASMHPTSLEELNLFGPYTENFSAIKAARLAIKHEDFDSASKMFDGRLAPFLIDEKGNYVSQSATDLEWALKIVINIVYGLTSAKFDNPFRDPRNKDNIVAKRGALFMIDLKKACEDAGIEIVHIKTDSVKIPNATPEAIEFVHKFGEKYGYTFDHEATYDKFCLVNDAVYIAKKTECLVECWTAVGAQFKHPYVFKSLFDPGPHVDDQNITFDDMCETKQVQAGVIYIDFNMDKPVEEIDPSKDLHHVGRIGRFVPVKEGYGGGILYRVKDGKLFAVTGTKGYFWVEAEVLKNRDGGPEEAMKSIEMDYFDSLIESARDTIEKFGSFEEFIK